MSSRASPRRASATRKGSANSASSRSSRSSNSNSNNDCNERDIDPNRLAGFGRLVTKVQEKVDAFVDVATGPITPASRSQFKSLGRQISELSDEVNDIWFNRISDCEKRLRVNPGENYRHFKEFVRQAKDAMATWKRRTRAAAGGGTRRISRRTA